MRFSRLLIGFAILLVIAGTAVVVLRKPLLEAGLAWWMRDLGVPLRTLTVQRLDHRTLVLRSVTLGPGDALSADTVELTYSLPEIVSSRLRAVRIDGLDISVDLQEQPQQLEQLIAVYRRARDRFAAGAGGAAVPQVDVTNGRLLLASDLGSANLPFRAATRPEEGERLAVFADLSSGTLVTPTVTLGDIAGPVSFEIEPDANASISSDLTIAAVTLDTDQSVPFELHARLGAGIDADRGTLDVSVAFDSPDAGIEIRAGSRLTNVFTRPEGAVDLSGTIDASGGGWNAVDRLAGGQGEVMVGFSGGLQLNPPAYGAALSTDQEPFVQLTGKGRLAANGLVVPGLGRADSDAIEFDITASDGSLDLRIKPGSILSVAPAAGQPPIAADLLSGEFSLDLSQSEMAVIRLTPDHNGLLWRAEMKPRIDLQATDGARMTMTTEAVLEAGSVARLAKLEGETDLAISGLSVTLPGLQVDNIRADMAIDFSGGDGALDLRLREAGDLTVGALSTATMRTRAPVGLVLADADVQASGLDTLEPSITASLDLQPKEAIQALIAFDGATDRSLEARLGSVRLAGSSIPGDCSSGTIAIDETTLESAGETYELRDARLTLSHDCPGGGILASGSVSSARQLGDRPLLAPVSILAHMTDADSGYAFDGRVSLLDGSELLVASGTASDLGSSGEIAIARTAPLVFSADGAAPADFSQAFKDLKRVRGQIDGSAVYRWSEEGASSEARLDVRNLALEIGAVSVSGLDLDLALQPAWPPSTPSSQVLSIERIDVGTALEDVLVSYEVPPAQPLQIRITGVEARLLGGTLRLDPFAVDPASVRTETKLHLAELDMAALAELTHLDGLDATGRLGGNIPVVLEDGTFAIRGGRLDAAGPGRLSFRSQKAAELLRGQGTEVDLMLQALRDFRYESLGLDLDKTASDDLLLKLSLLGHNPEVLDGQPFRINLNLTSQITPILDALATAYLMSRQTLQRVWTTR